MMNLKHNLPFEVIMETLYREVEINQTTNHYDLAIQIIEDLENYGWFLDRGSLNE